MAVGLIQYRHGTTHFPFLRRFLHGVLMRYPQTASQLIREFLVALLAHRLLVVFVEFRFLRHLVIANRASEVMNTPGFVQGGEHCKRFPQKK